MCQLIVPSEEWWEMSNKKVYLYDNGFAAAMQYSFSEDRGKRLENVVFRHLRARTEDIFLPGTAGNVTSLFFRLAVQRSSYR